MKDTKRDTLSLKERQEVEHCRKWIAQGGTQLVYAPMALQPLIDALDRVAPNPEKVKK